MTVFIWDLLFWEGEHEDDSEESLQGLFVATGEHQTVKINITDKDQKKKKSDWGVTILLE